MPATDHKTQLTTVAKVNGNGILLADFVFRTVFSEARGEPNMATQKSTAIFPIIDAASSTGNKAVTPAEAARTAIHAEMC